MKETIRERKKVAKRSPEEQRLEGEADVQAKIAEMPDEDRALAARIHEIVTATVPDLVPRTFYGMPAYAKDGKVVCFFQAKAKFKVRYSTLGFQHDARLDEGEIWPVAFAVTSLPRLARSTSPSWSRRPRAETGPGCPRSSLAAACPRKRNQAQVARRPVARWFRLARTILHMASRARDPARGRGPVGPATAHTSRSHASKSGPSSTAVARAQRSSAQPAKS